MKKNYVLFLLFAFILFAGKSYSQTIIPCGTDEMNAINKKLHPEIATYEKKLEDDITNYIKNQGVEGLKKFGKNWN